MTHAIVRIDSRFPARGDKELLKLLDDGYTILGSFITKEIYITIILKSE